jgi:2-amino-4-hydroxy-6-hydroxymethyldihydropteridine diphosphokinase
MILISIGANLPLSDAQSPLAACQAAAAEICALAPLAFVALSSWYRTAPIPPSDQPDYCNGVIRLDGEPDPAALLAVLQEIETRHGRVRSTPNAPRTLDLDIIDINGTIRATPDPILPHPRTHLRGFVLRPILDVAPAWRHPVLRLGISAMLAELPPQGVQPWYEGGA